MKRQSGTLCPICGKPADPVLSPFCCKRCKDVDLNRWLGGVYAIPAVETDDFPDDAPDGDDGEGRR